jgi:hypothetical protein
MAMACSRLVGSGQRQGKRLNRLDLSNGMQLAPLTNVTDDSRTMLCTGLVTRRPVTSHAGTSDLPVIEALPPVL